MAIVHEITSKQAWVDFVRPDGKGPENDHSKDLFVIYFSASWAAPCKQMSVVVSTLASTYSANAPISFVSFDAEDVSEVSEHYGVSSVPLVLVWRFDGTFTSHGMPNGPVLEEVPGSDAAKVRAAVEKHAGAGSGEGAKSSLPVAQTVTKPAHPVNDPAANGTLNGTKNLSSYAPSSADPKTAPEYSSSDTTSKEELFQRLGELVKAAPVMLFMKGTPSAPQCGFSRQTVSILREKQVRYGFFNILADDEVRQGLKEFADWPTFPQLWVGGELVGGLDIVREEFENDPDFLKEYSINAPKATGGPPAPPS
ncbi:glutaredoxin [Lojkania enalia]|uniref:Glutaredoxin n=1 Tax=Lojkania enalia TaxID=147567 RepID=A0A9P4NC26_9PLEO|nr:glutaredoxin [Didymosphaeria enalia]